MKILLAIISIVIIIFSNAVKSESFVKSVFKESTPSYTNLFPVPSNEGVYVATGSHHLALRQFIDTGLANEYVIEVDEINNLDSYYDPVRNQIWRDYLKIEATDNVITGETSRLYNVYQLADSKIELLKTEQTFGDFEGYYVYGVSDGIAYLSPPYDSTKVVIYDTDNKVKLNEIQESGVDKATHVLSHDGSYLVSLLKDGEITLTEFEDGNLVRRSLNAPELKSNQYLKFIEKDILLARYSNYFIIYSVNEQRDGLTQLFRATDAVLKEQFNINGQSQYSFNDSSLLVTLSSYNLETYSYDLVYLKLSKVNSSWQINRLEPISNSIYENYSVTFKGKIIASLAKYELIDGVWQGNNVSYKGINHVYDNFAVTNLDNSNELYILTQTDRLYVKKLVYGDAEDYFLSDVSSFPVQSDSITNAFKVNNLLYVTNSRNQFIEINIDTNDFKFSQIEYSDGYFGNKLKAVVRDEKIFFYGFQLIMCDVDSLECVNKKPAPNHDRVALINNNFITMTRDDEKNIVRLSIDSPETWREIDVSDLAEDTRLDKLEPIGSSLTANNGRYFLTFDENWTLTLSSPDILNSARDYVNLPNELVFNNGSVTCDNHLTKCAAVNEKMTLYFEPIDKVLAAIGWHFPENVGNQKYIFNKGTSGYELFVLEEGITFPAPLKSFKEYETKIHPQTSTVEFDLNGHIGGIEEYLSSFPTYTSDAYYFEDFILDQNGVLSSVELTNEHTWRELAIPIRNYTGTNDRFSVELEPVYLQVKDINDAPELIEGTSLTYSVVKDQHLYVSLNSLFMDPERKSLSYSLEQDLPKGIELSPFGYFIEGIPTDYGFYNITVIVTEAYADEDEQVLSSAFTLMINVTNEEGVVPSKEKGGSMSFLLLVMLAITMTLSRRNKVAFGQ